MAESDREDGGAGAREKWRRLKGLQWEPGRAAWEKLKEVWWHRGPAGMDTSILLTLFIVRALNNWSISGKMESGTDPGLRLC